MKKLILFIVSAILSISAFAQVTTDPVFITKGYADEFDVIFDATKGNGGMVGATDCYAHTGVITTASKSDADWKHAPTWGTNTAKYKMTSIGENLWKLTITDGMTSYYGLTAQEVVTKLAFVFRNSTSTMQGKTADDGDIFYTLYEAGSLNIMISEPLNGAMFSEGQDVSYDITVSDNTITQGTLTFDGKAQTVNLTNGNVKGVFTTPSVGTHNVKFSVSNASTTASDSTYFVVSSTQMNKPLPEGMQEGINYNSETKEVTLLFRAPLNQDVYILGDFNDWKINEDYHMYYADTILADKVISSVEKTRIFWRTFKVADPTKKYAFIYRVDGTKYVGDPYATVVLDPWNDQYISAGIRDSSLPKYPSAVSNVIVPVLVLEEKAYDWKYSDFKIEDKTQLVIYELLIRDFTTAKNLNGVISKLDYLKELGINAIELMPIIEFDGNDSWGYGPSFFFAYDKAYGKKDQYKKLIDECHKRGIAVILDVAFNHCTGNCPFASLYWDDGAPASNNPWLNREAKHPWNVFNDFNHEYEGTRKYFRRALKYWLEEFKVDGFRMDLAKGFSQRKTTESTCASYDKSRVKILKDYCDAVTETNPNAVYILEYFVDYTEELEMSKYGALPWRKMNSNFCNAASGSSSGSNFVNASGGKDTKGGMYDLGWVGYPESHDEERNMYSATKSSVSAIRKEEVYLKRVPLDIAFTALLPGPKMIWEFTEMGYDISINQCAGSTKIQESCRTDAKPNIWAKKWDKDSLRNDAYERSSKIINLRTQHPEFFTDSTVTTTNCGTASYLMTKIRRIDAKYVDSSDPDNNVDIIVLANYNASAQRSMVGNFSRTGVWYEYLTNTEFYVDSTSLSVAVEPNGIKIFTSRNLNTPVAVDEVEGNGSGISVSISPTVTDNMLYIQCSEKILYVNIYGMSGELLKSVEGNANSVSLAGFNKGMYLVSVNCVGGKSVHKIIKN